MSKIIIEPKNKDEEKLILSFLRDQNIRVQWLSHDPTTDHSIYDQPYEVTDQFEALSSILEKQASENLFGDIDPASWQKALRDEWE